jgi:hypothetical protein
LLVKWKFGTQLLTSDGAWNVRKVEQMKRYFTIGLMLAGLSMMANAETLAERQANQRARIRQGVQSGELTKTEAQRLRAEERQLHRQVVRNRADGGGLNRAERTRLQAKASRDSRKIRRLKHNSHQQ